MSPSRPTAADTHVRTLSVSSPADVLSYIPHALGFTPVESLVVMTTAGKRLGATLRVDLPRKKPAREDDAVSYAHAVLSFLTGDTDADGTLLAVYTRDRWTHPASPPHSGLVQTLGEVLEAAGLPVRSSWLVSGAVWRDYRCTEVDCCPWPGHPLDTVTDSHLNAEMVFGGSSFEPSASEAVLRSTPAVARTGAVPDVDTWRVEDAQAHYAAACAGHWNEPVQFEATARFWDAVLKRQDIVHAPGRSGSSASESGAVALTTRGSGEVLDADVAGFLLASVESKAVRDFLLVSACLGSDIALDAVDSGEDPPLDSPLSIVTSNHGRTPGFVLPPLALAWEELLAPRRACRDEAADAKEVHPTSGARLIAQPAHHLFTEVLGGLYSGAIDWRRVGLMTGVLIRLAAVAGECGEARAAVLTMLGWFDYARGRGSRAAVYFDAAEAALPGYRLARLLNELLCRGGLPEWARNRSTAWHSGAGAGGPGAAW